MKKMLSIILALVLCLSAVSAIAEAVPSITPDDLIRIVTEPAFEVTVDPADAPTDSASEALEEGLTLNEVFAVTGIEGDEDGDVVLYIYTPTVYAENQEVVVLIGIKAAEETIDWAAFDGVGTADGAVKVTVPAEKFAEMKANLPVYIAIAVKA